MKTIVILFVVAVTALSCNQKSEANLQNCNVNIGVDLIKDSVYFKGMYIASVSPSLNMAPARSKSYDFTDSVFSITGTGPSRWTKCFFLLVDKDGTSRWLGEPNTFFGNYSFSGRIYTFRIRGVGDDGIKGIVRMYIRVGTILDSLNIDLDKNVLDVKPSLEIPPGSLPILDSSSYTLAFSNMCQTFPTVYGYKSYEYSYFTLPITLDTITVNTLAEPTLVDTLRFYFLPI